MNEPIKDGGPAFPINIDRSAINVVDYSGMSLRDFFAGQALSSVLKSSGDLQCYYEYKCGSKGDNLIPLPSSVASYCYELADAMLKERDKQ